MFILLAVFWVAGSLLLAAESPSTRPKPAAAAAAAAKESETQAEESGRQGRRRDKKAAERSKSAPRLSTRQAGKGSIAEQAEAALKAAAEADPGGAAKERAAEERRAGTRRTTRRCSPPAAPPKRLRRSASCRPSRFAPTSTSHFRSTSDAKSTLWLPQPHRSRVAFHVPERVLRHADRAHLHHRSSCTRPTSRGSGRTATRSSRPSRRACAPIRTSCQSARSSSSSMLRSRKPRSSTSCGRC